MKTLASVLGVLGACRVDFGNSTQVRTSKISGCKALCRVCWVCARAHAYARIFISTSPYQVRSKKLYARTEKPNKPNTLNTDRLKVLFLKGFFCVGFVLGCGFFVSGSVFRGNGQ